MGRYEGGFGQRIVTSIGSAIAKLWGVIPVYLRDSVLGRGISVLIAIAFPFWTAYQGFPDWVQIVVFAHGLWIVRCTFLALGYLHWRYGSLSQSSRSALLVRFNQYAAALRTELWALHRTNQDDAIPSSLRSSDDLSRSNEHRRALQDARLTSDAERDALREQQMVAAPPNSPIRKRLSEFEQNLVTTVDCYEGTTAQAHTAAGRQIARVLDETSSWLHAN